MAEASSNHGANLKKWAIIFWILSVIMTMISLFHDILSFNWEKVIAFVNSGQLSLSSASMIGPTVALILSDYLKIVRKKTIERNLLFGFMIIIGVIIIQFSLLTYNDLIVKYDSRSFWASVIWFLAGVIYSISLIYNFKE